MFPFDPISATISAVGFGLQLFGGMKQADIAHQQADVSADVAGHEQQINSLKQQQTTLEASRMQLQNVRNNQRARAQATSAAVTQGAQFGTGLQGGLSDINNQSMFNMQGVNDALWTSNRIFDQNSAISQDKIKMAQLGGDAASAQGLTSLGGSLLKVGPTVGNIAGAASNFKITGLNNLFGGGSPSGYGA